MNLKKIKERLDKMWDEAVKFQQEARAFDVPWSVPYEFSAYANDVMWEDYGKTEKFWAEKACHPDENLYNNPTMKIDLNAIDQTQFMMHPHIMFGETLWLVQPNHIGAKFTQANKIFRSSVWNDQGELVSAGFPKFTNWGENPENFPVPTSLKDCHVIEKLDGSLLIASQYKGNLILRTRGTVDATKLDNGHELEIFKRKYKNALDWLLMNYLTPSGHSSYSLLFEWVSPEQRIILNYGDEPEWYLVGCVHHEDYSLKEQYLLDDIAKQHGFKRPASYRFPSIEALMADVEQWKGKEGVVVYSGNGQVLHKCKSMWYLSLHRMKEALASVDKVVDVYFEQGTPSYSEFEKYITDQFDYELWSQVRPEASRICDAWKNVQQIVEGMKVFVEQSLRPLATRRDQAQKVISSYGPTNRSSMVFTLLDNKPLDSEQLKKLLYQCLKK